jgi:hypothetical protein
MTRCSIFDWNGYFLPSEHHTPKRCRHKHIILIVNTIMHTTKDSQLDANNCKTLSCSRLPKAGAEPHFCTVHNP